MTLELYTKKLFFDAPIEKFDKSLLTFFKNEKKLNEVIYEGYTLYPPLSALEQSKSEWHIFQFKNHPHIDFGFKDGEIELKVHRQTRKKIYIPVMKFSFGKEEEVQAAFQSLINNFEGTSKKNSGKSRIAEFQGKEYQVNLSYGKGDVLIDGYVLLLFLTRYLD